MSITGLESSENAKVPSTSHEQPRVVHWQTSGRAGARRMRPYTDES